MNKLLSKSLKAFILYAGIVLACSIPAYYFIIDLIWQHELKEHNLIISASVKQNIRNLSLPGEDLARGIQLWNKLQPEKQLKPVDRLQPDSTYNIYRRNQYIPAKGTDRFEGLVTYFEIDGKPYSLTVETNMEESHETIIAIAVITFFFFALLLGGFIYLNRRISRRLWQPFYQSLQKISQFDLNRQQPVMFEKTDIAEFEALNSHLQKLISANIAAYRQQKEFTENASHELQTPLAIVQGKLDLLLQSKPLTDEQSTIIDDTHTALSRVTRINKNLLLLARLENSQFSGKEMIDLGALLEKTLALLHDFAEDRSLAVEKNIPAGVKVMGNKILAEILLTNLLSNAIRHTEKGGTVTVTLSEHTLTIANTGREALRMENLFQRFGTASSHTPGTGLGLAIVQEICRHDGWKAAYSFGQGRHVFNIDFRVWILNSF